MESILGRSLEQTPEVNIRVGGRETYRVSFPRIITSVACLVEE